MIRRVLAVAALTALPVAAGLGAPQHASAQELAVVDSLARTGDAQAARERLARWWETEGEDADRPAVQQALWLRGLLTLSPLDAQADFRRLTVEYPGGPFTDRALLRLARYAYTRDRLAEAVRHFRTLALDHPGTPAALEAREWLERHAEAVEAAEAAEAVDAERRAAARSERAADTVPAETTAADTTVAGATDSTVAVPAEPGTDTVVGEPADPDTVEADPAEEASEEPDAESGPYTVQLGAFSSERRAMTLVERARDAGLEPRVVTVSGSDLVRVRVGRFDDAGGATRLYDRVRRLGFEATVSGDADREEGMR